MRGDAVTPGYWNRPDANEEKWSDGWFRTGDLVSRDADGYLYYVDRIDDMIVTGGENVFPQMVEEHLASCPDLAEVAVIGTAHERWVQQVTAVVVPSRPGVTADDVAAWCATNPEPGRDAPAAADRDRRRPAPHRQRQAQPARAAEAVPVTVRYTREGPVAWLTIDRPRPATRCRRRCATASGSGCVGSSPTMPPCSCSPARASGRSARAGTSRRWPTPPWRCRRRTSCRSSAATSTCRSRRSRRSTAWRTRGGFLLAQQCDLVVAAEHATFAVSEVRVGRGAPWAAPLPWLVGPRAAAEILLTGDPVSAPRAYEIGLVNRVVPGVELHDHVQALAERIAANAPLSVAAAKRTVYLSAPDAWAQAEEVWAPVYRSADAQEGPRAFRERRTPVWVGR